jgi:CHAT domain-containing protein/Tfp pilus assembly protein PilF
MIVFRYLRVFLFVALIFSVAQPALSQQSALEKAKALSQHVIELYRQGRYQEAIIPAQKALAILEKTLGPEHPSVAAGLHNLAELYCSSGDYSKAEPLYKRSLAVREKALGPEHHDVATSLNSLALLYKSLGDYAKAEPMYKRSLAIWEKALGPEHPDVSTSLNNLAELYRAIGDYAKAEPFYKRSLAIAEKTLGPEHPSVAISLNNLALLYQSLGNYAKAEPLFKRSLTVLEKALGPNHPYVAQSLNNLAGLYDLLGDYAKAESLLKRSLGIREKALGPDHYHVAQSLNNLAGVYRALGDYAKAMPLYTRSLAIREKALGPSHPHVSTGLYNLAGLYAALDDFQKAHGMYVKAQQIDGKLIDQIMGFTSERQKMKFLSMKEWDLFVFLSLVDQYLSQDPSARKDALDGWLRRKGIILEAQKRFQEALVYSDDPQAIKTFQKLASVRAQLSKLAFSGPGKAGPEAHKKQIAGLEAKKSKLEARLSQLSKAFAVKQKVSKADSLKVSNALPEDTALLEFARIRKYNFKAKGKEKKWLPAHYLAFVVHAGRGGKPGMVDLGDAGEIDRAVTHLKKEIVDSKDIKDPERAKASKKLYKLVFEPLLRELGNKREIFISPDGNLNLMPFEVLQRPDGRFLIEDYTFNYLAAGRDIIGFGEITEKGNKALLMGDPDFDMGTGEKDSTLSRLSLTRVKHERMAVRSSDMRGFHFSRLPGTRQEVKAIYDLLGKDRVELYLGKEALEEVLRSKGTPRILHLATHGFFLTDLELDALAGDAMDRGIHISSMAPKATEKPVKIENPLLRSGIALAGANKSIKSGDTDKSDGIVTAEKILGLKLRGTDMVVLSACETGVGEVQTGEGIFGLRRAFTQAGAKSLVMSMWSVPDRETKELMVEFYRNIQSGEMDRCKALRQAALKEMKILKKRYGHTNPFYWAAFVFMGEP